ncbi:MAG: response regulator [Deltaproteobacteria bacterium]|nr:response regulator [Deltaproteobacteria bacterium]
MDPHLRVLVVDDFNTMRRLIKNALGQMGLKNISEAEDGEAAIVKLETDRVDLVICDWNMPRMSGIDLLRWVRAHDEFHDMPFVMVTAEGQKENVMEAIKARVSNYVVKPFTTEVLQEKVEKALGKRGKA